MRIVVCDPGLGNVRSVVRAVEACSGAARGAAPTVTLTGDPDELRRADVLVVPGQGHFGAFAEAMRGGLGEVLTEKIRAGTPYLGICLGMQVLFDTSDEAPGARGLAIFEGHVARMSPAPDPETGRARPLPHVGWNAVEGPVSPAAPRHFYFAHSYVVVPDDPSLVAGTTDYGGRFVSAVRKDAVLGVQFHPEKSQRAGLSLLERFFGG